MKKYLGIGSCRILTPLFYLNNKDRIIYNTLENWYVKPCFTGNHFLGKLHNTKEIIQFIRLIKGDITLPTEVLSLFLTSFSSFRLPKIKREKNPEEILNEIKNNFNEIDKFFIEISSIKTFIYKNNAVFLEHISSNNPFIKNYKELEHIQSKEELLEDLDEIVKLLGEKKVVFISHFNFDGINNRQIIKDALLFISKKYEIPVILPYEDLKIKEDKKILQNDLLHYTFYGLEKIKSKLESIME